MAAKKQQEDRRVVFRRIGGRVVPIRKKSSNQDKAGKAISAGGVIAGGAIAGGAASKKTALISGNTRIHVRKVPFVNPKGSKGHRFQVFNVMTVSDKRKGILGKLGLRKNQGFSIFSLKRKGVDLPSIFAENSRAGALLFKETAKQGKAKGARVVRGRVLQNPDLIESISKRGGKFFSFTEKRGRNIRVSKSAAKRIARRSAKDVAGGAAISSIQKIPKGIKPGKLFRTKGNRLQIAGGLALAGAGALGLFEKKKRRKKNGN